MKKSPGKKIRQENDEAKFKKTTSWLTDDDYEIKLRKHRAQVEPMLVKRLAGSSSNAVFADYEVSRTDQDLPQKYAVEIRSVDSNGNFCTCPDFEKNFLGTCKHIEKTLIHLHDKFNKIRAGSPFVEISLTPGQDRTVMVYVPGNVDSRTKSFIENYFESSGNLRTPSGETLMTFMRDMKNQDAGISGKIRISHGVKRYAGELSLARILALKKESVLKDMREGRRSADIVRYPLYDYQLEGMIHLALTGRAMLADEMGLGKTVQAVAACKLLQEICGIRKVLVVCPTSLKLEWEEQIRKFSDLPSVVVSGLRPARLSLYESSQAFFHMTNYEQIVRDEKEINEILRPDVVILDEAQRIKNWRTRTSASVKRLRSEYAFVLTGTPIENRIDELFSLTEFVNPKIFGSLFRFNRQFYEFDEDGKMAGIKNMRMLHEQLRPIMLRRKKTDINEQLPERIDNNYYVGMTEEQIKRYDEYESLASRILAQAKKRPLTPEEFEKLQRLLACMRMLCDTVYILDKKFNDAPKLDELFKILDDLWEDDPSRKVIIFSEWIGMLELARKRFGDMDVSYAWHTGSVQQDKRRVEINRFKNDPECKVFLSTDSGGVGLNLQVASVVVNLDLPWNPAKLEQRISRAWRKHQKNSVNVINIIAEKTIEHKMLATLDFKKELAEKALDLDGDVENFKMISSRAQFMERLEKILQTSFGQAPQAGSAVKSGETVMETEIEKGRNGECAAVLPPYECARQAIILEFGAKIKSFKAKTDLDGNILEALLVMEDKSSDATERITALFRKNSSGIAPSRINILTHSNYEALLKLAEAGLVTFNDSSMLDLIKYESLGEPKPDDDKRRNAMAESLMVKSERKLKMAECLLSGGFIFEAFSPAMDFLELAGVSLMSLCSETPFEKEQEKFDPAYIQIFRERNILPRELCGLFERHGNLELSEENLVAEFVGQCRILNSASREYLMRRII